MTTRYEIQYAPLENDWRYLEDKPTLKEARAYIRQQDDFDATNNLYVYAYRIVKVTRKVVK